MKNVLAVAALGLSALWTLPAAAQTAEVKEKPPLYTYIGSFAIPRAKWGELEKQTAGEQNRSAVPEEIGRQGCHD